MQQEFKLSLDLLGEISVQILSLTPDADLDKAAQLLNQEVRTKGRTNSSVNLTDAQATTVD